MGTFHHDRCDLHGITVVVDTDGAETYVGRCDDIDARGVVLLDADLHRHGEDGRTKQEYLQRAARFGVWKKFDRLLVPRARVKAIRRLGEI